MSVQYKHLFTVCKRVAPKSIQYVTIHFQGKRMVNSRLRGFKIWDRDFTSKNSEPRDSKSPKFTMVQTSMKVSGSPPIYCFPLLYCLNFIAQFDKLSPRILKNSTPEDQTERKNDRFETPRLRDPSKRLLRFRDRSKLFWNLRLSKYHSIPLYFQHYLRMLWS